MFTLVILGWLFLPVYIASGVIIFIVIVAYIHSVLCLLGIYNARIPPKTVWWSKDTNVFSLNYIIVVSYCKNCGKSDSGFPILFPTYFDVFLINKVHY